jgi:uncharacterized protein YndB with AHSA1/START domain
MKWLGIIVGTLAGLCLIVIIVGALRPADHTARVAVTIDKPRADVWAVIADAEHMPSWFTEAKSVERIADIDGKPTYHEQYGGWTATVVIRESVEGQRLVREIQPGGGFSGSWTMELADAGAGTRLTITERGHVNNPLFRGMMVFVSDTRTMRQYADALARKLGTTAVPVS